MERVLWLLHGPGAPALLEGGEEALRDFIAGILAEQRLQRPFRFVIKPFTFVDRYQDGVHPGVAAAESQRLGAPGCGERLKLDEIGVRGLVGKLRLDARQMRQDLMSVAQLQGYLPTLEDLHV